MVRRIISDFKEENSSAPARAHTMQVWQTFSFRKRGGIYLNKTKLIVTRVFDSRRTPQDAFVRAILNSDKEEKCLQASGDSDIIETGEPLCSSPAFSGKGEANG